MKPSTSTPDAWSVKLTPRAKLAAERLQRDLRIPTLSMTVAAAIGFLYERLIDGQPLEVTHPDESLPANDEVFNG